MQTGAATATGIRQNTDLQIGNPWQQQACHFCRIMERGRARNMQRHMPALGGAELQLFRAFGQKRHGIHDRNADAVLQGTAASAGQNQHPCVAGECALVGGGKACRAAGLTGMSGGLTAAALGIREGRIIARGLQLLQECHTRVLLVTVRDTADEDRILAACRRRWSARWRRPGQ